MNPIYPDPNDLDAMLPALRAALEGGPPIVLGAGPVGDATADLPEGTAAVITTSGSSGVPKSVVLPADALLASAEATTARCGAGSWLLALPAGYVAGLQVLVRSLVQGARAVRITERFTPQAFLAATREMGGADRRLTSLVPPQLAVLLDSVEQGDADVSAAIRSFDAILVGGQSLAPTLRERARHAGAQIVRTYGSTETSGGCVYDGVPLDGVRLRIRDGEVQVGGRTLASGYVGASELTARVFVTDDEDARWYRTGDAGSIDNGVLRVHGRIDNVIVTGGINVSLDRVERSVRSVPGLEHAVVIGVTDDRWGEASVIVGARADSHPHQPPDLLAAARAAVTADIGAHARPSRLELVDAIELLPSGKPDRQTIRRSLTRH